MRGRHRNYKLSPKKIGSGGQAEVFAATVKATGETLALKRVVKVANKTALARLRREVEVQSTLKHSNIVPILDFDLDEGWFTMPLAEGDLANLRENGYSIDPLEVLVHVSNALVYAHGEGIVHRDVKPQNVLLFRPSTWMLSDWGFVKRPPGKTTNQRTRVGVTWGTAGFVAPEVARDGHKADSRSDVFSLGRLAYWLVAEQWPPEGELELSQLSAPWRDLISSACQADPNRRMQSASEFLGEVQMLLRLVSANDAVAAVREYSLSTVAFGALLRECTNSQLVSTTARAALFSMGGAELRARVAAHSASLIDLVAVVAALPADGSASISQAELFDWVDLLARAAGYEGVLALQEAALSCLIRMEMTAPKERHRKVLHSTLGNMMRMQDAASAMVTRLLNASPGSREHIFDKRG